MKFIVEVPVYLRLAVTAPDADAAAMVAERISAEAIVSRGELVPLDSDEDRAPDVYVCRGGKLTFVDETGGFEPTLDSC